MKNYTEEEKEMINGLLESYTNDYWISGGKHIGIRSEICLEDFQEANGLTPKPKLEVGKFYKLTGDYCSLRKGMVLVIMLPLGIQYILTIQRQKLEGVICHLLLKT